MTNYLKTSYQKACPQCLEHSSSRRGISLIETLVVVAIIGVLLVIILPRFSQIRENQVLKNATVETLSAINKARSITLASVNSSQYGVRFQSDRVIIFKGTVYNEGSADNETINIISPASITNVTLAGVSGTSGEFYFNRLYGSPSKTGTVTITASSSTKTIIISASGVSSMN